MAPNERRCLVSQVGTEWLAGTPIRGNLAKLADDKGADVRAAGLTVQGIDAIIPDLRVGHGYDLSAVGRIRDHLLISRHRGVETDFSGGGSGGSERVSFETASVF
jgi:hypothetical protein